PGRAASLRNDTSRRVVSGCRAWLRVPLATGVRQAGSRASLGATVQSVQAPAGRIRQGGLKGLLQSSRKRVGAAPPRPPEVHAPRGSVSLPEHLGTRACENLAPIAWLASLSARPPMHSRRRKRSAAVIAM